MKADTAERVAAQTAQMEVLLPTAVAHGFDYLAPVPMGLRAGDIVSVPFGRGDTLGVVWGAGTANIPMARIRHVTEHLTQFPPLSDAMRQFIDWAAWYNCAPKGAILKMVLPIDDIAKEGRKGTSSHIETSIDESRIQLASLSDMQKEAAGILTGNIGKGFTVHLLDGVTGSGKTEVYFEAIAHALKQKPQARPAGRASHEPSHMEFPARVASNSKPAADRGTENSGDNHSQILIMLPEIALSVQFLERFESRFGFKPVLWNSEIPPARKRASWQAIAKGEARVVIGARSALFLPYKNLSLIIADEEHDGSYKQEDGVIYHARDMAVARARFEKIPVVLVSATPSLETYYNTKAGKYTEVPIAARHGEAEMPDVEMLDMRKVFVEKGAFISTPLREKLADAIRDGHQAMLFLNRRGYAPLVLCRACGHRFQCPECTAWMVLHKGKPRLECHHCGYRLPMPDTCPSCQAKDNFAACGPGVERILDEVNGFMPQARVAVMASDSTSGFSELSETITAMSEKRIDVLIGTQMIAKGHHFADLAVVGVVDADLGLAGGDLRAAERTYQLLHQLSGRAGRETVHGRVYLQSFLPEHPVMKALVGGDRDAFLAAELQARKNASMPPFTRLAALIIDGTKEEQVLATAKKLAATAPADKKVHVMGPAPAPLYMLRGKYRYRLLVKADRAINLPDLMRSWVDAQAAPSSVRIRIDIDPMSFV